MNNLNLSKEEIKILRDPGNYMDKQYVIERLIDLGLMFYMKFDNTKLPRQTELGKQYLKNLGI